MTAEIDPCVPPLEPPSADDVQALLKRWTGSAPDREPLKLRDPGSRVRRDESTRWGASGGLVMVGLGAGVALSGRTD